MENEIIFWIWDVVQYKDKNMERVECPCCEKTIRVKVTCDRCFRKEEWEMPELDITLHRLMDETGWLVFLSSTYEELFTYCAKCRIHYYKLHNP